MQNILCCLFLIGLSLTACKTPEARRPLSTTGGSYTRSIEMNKQRHALEEEHIADMMARDSLHEYRTSEYGFWYYYDREISTETERPEFGDVIEFEYNVKDLAGNVLYKKEELGKVVYHVDKEELITGLREGLKLMRAGETVTFVFPSYKAYGYYGDQDRIMGNMPIVSTVTLNYIQESQVIEP